MSAMELSVQLSDMLMRAGYAGRIHRISLLTSGGNNKAWRVDADAGRFLAKRYFRHDGDLRDRLSSEFEFARYAAVCAPELVAKAIHTEPASGFSIFQFLSGQPVRAGEVGADEVHAAARFFAALNGKNRLLDAAHLPTASEACFSITEHLSLVRRRIDNLLEAFTQTPAGDATDAAAFVSNLSRYWKMLEASVVAASQADAIAVDLPLPPEDRCLSPSDFGFHNALRSEVEGIRFIDFEYAGWDDPAKMVGDFFAQLAVPVPLKFFDLFVDTALSGFMNKRALIRRAELLRPVYQTKWCCIALNVFLPVNLARRKFANPDLDEMALKERQLAKAKSLFQSMDTIDHGLH
jgi:hypothetical protein